MVEKIQCVHRTKERIGRHLQQLMDALVFEIALIAHKFNLPPEMTALLVSHTVFPKNNGQCKTHYRVVPI